jgi:hypothetical protein
MNACTIASDRILLLWRDRLASLIVGVSSCAEGDGRVFARAVKRRDDKSA